MLGIESTETLKVIVNTDEQIENWRLLIRIRYSNLLLHKAERNEGFYKNIYQSVLICGE